MEIAASLMLAAVVIGVGFYVAIPFIAPRRAAAVGASEHELSSLLAERDRLIGALRELDFDHALGKIPDEAYPEQRAQLLQRGAEVLRQIDAISPPTAQAQAGKPGPDAEMRIEAAVAARRADLAGEAMPAPSSGDDEIESRVAARRSERRDKSGGFCPNCGKPILVSDKFCPHCGRAI
jgi:hypothetical protein